MGLHDVENELEEFLQQVFGIGGDAKEEWHRARFTADNLNGVPVVKQHKGFTIESDVYVNVLNPRGGILVNESTHQTMWIEDGVTVVVQRETGRAPLSMLQVFEQVERFRCQFCREQQFVTAERLAEIDARPTQAGAQACKGTHNHRACDEYWQLAKFTAGNEELNMAAAALNAHRDTCRPCAHPIAPLCPEGKRLLNAANKVQLGEGWTLLTLTQEMMDRRAAKHA